MSIDFIVVSGERSGSTWAANWLTTDTTLCYHDPLMRWRQEELSHLPRPRGKRIGIACTAQGQFPEWVNRQVCPTVVLHREHAQIDASWTKLGVAPFLVKPDLNNVWGLHYTWQSLFDPTFAKEIYEYLLHETFDAERHHELVQMNVQPHFDSVSVTGPGVKELVQRIKALVQ